MIRTACGLKSMCSKCPLPCQILLGFYLVNWKAGAAAAVRPACPPNAEATALGFRAFTTHKAQTSVERP